MKRLQIAAQQASRPVYKFLSAVTLWLLLLFCPHTGSTQQNITVSGKVTDNKGMVLGGVTVLRQGNNRGTVSSNEGIYSITALSTDTLEFSFVGMTTKKIAVNSQSVIDVSFDETAIGLEEVVAIGYRTKTRGELTGAIGVVSGRDVASAVTPSIQQALQGRVAGLVVSDRGGAPGNPGIEFLVRGKSSLGQNQPLVIVNGAPRDDWQFLSGNDIESVTVLKDASAAIYGAQAANGVVLIQTKQGGKNEKTRFSVLSEFGFQQSTRRVKLMDSYQRATYLNEGSAYAGQQPWFTPQEIEHFRTGDAPLEYPNTDWYKEIVDGSAPQTHHNVSAQGGSQNVQFYLSGDYVSQQGLLSSGDLNFEQVQATANVSVQATKNLKIGANVYYRSGRREEPTIANPFHQSLLWTFPWIISRWPNGLMGPLGEHGSPLAFIDRDYAQARDVSDDIFNGKVDFAYDLSSLVSGLNVSGYANFERRNSSIRHVRGPYTYYTRNAVTGEYTAQQAPGGVSAFEGTTNDVTSRRSAAKNDFLHVRINYNRNFGQHHVSGFVAYEQNELESHFIEGYRRDLPTRTSPYLWAGSTTGMTNSEGLSRAGRLNYFGSLSYNFKRRYLLDLTLRRDGSFNFPKNRRFGTFYGISGAYIISEEAFMQDIKWLDNLKLRVSYGKTGNDVVPQFQYLAKYSYGNAYAFGMTPQMRSGFIPSTVPNPNITWENAYQQNYGVDVILLQGLFSVSVDYFQEKRRDILLARNAQVPNYTAMQLPNENFGKVDNKGIEFTVNHRNKIGKLDVSVGGNFTYVRNKVIEMAEPANTPEWRKREGRPMDSYVLYLTDGIFNTPEEIAQNPHITGLSRPGDVRYRDIDGDGTITGNDQVRLFASPIPQIQYGINSSISYMGFELNLFLQGQAKAKVSMYSSDNLFTPYIFERRWTDQHVNAEYPRSFLPDDAHMRVSDFWLRDASFIRLKNASLAYNLPMKWISGAGVNNVRVYLTGRNLLTFDKLRDFNVDPEKGDGNGAYPHVMTLLIGATITF